MQLPFIIFQDTAHLHTHSEAPSKQKFRYSWHLPNLPKAAPVISPETVGLEHPGPFLFIRTTVHVNIPVDGMLIKTCGISSYQFLKENSTMIYFFLEVFKFLVFNLNMEQNAEKHIRRTWDEVATIGVTKCFWVSFLKAGVCACLFPPFYLWIVHKYCSNNLDKVCLEYKLHFLE